jgi:hypothetical protein
VQAISQKGDEDVGLDARLELVKDRPDLGVHHASPTINFETINSQAQR